MAVVAKPALNLGKVDPFNTTEPLQHLYDEAIQLAQGGVDDNVLKRMRFFVLSQLATHAARLFPDLDAAECGCFHGHSTYMLSRLFDAHGSRGRLHVFDSFEGLSDFTPADLSPSICTPDAIQKWREHYRGNFERVSALVDRFPFVSLYKGWIPERFAEVDDRRFGFVSIDVDLFEPIRDSLAFFWPRLVDGGLLYLDDYGFNAFPGARKAVDQFFADAAPTTFLRMPFGSALAIK